MIPNTHSCIHLMSSHSFPTLLHTIQDNRLCFRHWKASFPINVERKIATDRFLEQRVSLSSIDNTHTRFYHLMGPKPRRDIYLNTLPRHIISPTFESARALLMFEQYDDYLLFGLCASSTPSFDSTEPNQLQVSTVVNLIS